MIIVHEGISFRYEGDVLEVEGREGWQLVGPSVDEEDVILTITEYVEDLKYLAAKLEK